MKTLSHIWYVQGMNEAIWRDVYIIRGSYLTYLWPCIRPGIVCVHGHAHPLSLLSLCVLPTADSMLVPPLRCSCARLSVSSCRPCSTGRFSDASSYCSGSSESGWRGSSLSGWGKQRSASRYIIELFNHLRWGRCFYFGIGLLWRDWQWHPASSGPRLQWLTELFNVSVCVLWCQKWHKDWKLSACYECWQAGGGWKGRWSLIQKPSRASNSGIIIQHF